MATRIQETVAMDLESYKGHTLLHLKDHFTHLSASSVIPNKKPETIIQSIFNSWTSVYGSAEQFLSDNGGKFANKDFMDMCETLGITVKTTAVESSWSNSLVERHNLVLSEVMDKIIDETDFDISLAVSWCINAKNSLHNMHSFSPYQLTLGMNPKLPSILSDKLPALTNKPVSKVISQNLEALHKAREAFIAAENSGRIRRALSHNIHTTCKVKYMTGDQVYFKRANSREWHGPATVPGQDGQQVLVKSGSTCIRVHPCRLQLISRCDSTASSTLKNNKRNSHNATAATKLDPPYQETMDPPDLSNSETKNISSHRETQANRAEANTNNNTTIHEDIDLKLLKANTNVKLKINPDSNWETVKLTSRARTLTGKYKNWWNTENTYTDDQKSVDLSNVLGLEIIKKK